MKRVLGGPLAAGEHRDPRPGSPNSESVLLGGSWVLISRVISPLIWVITICYLTCNPLVVISGVKSKVTIVITPIRGPMTPFISIHMNLQYWVRAFPKIPQARLIQEDFSNSKGTFFKL